MRLRFLFSPGFILFLSDCAAIFASCVAAFFLRFITSDAMAAGQYAETLPWLLLFPLLYLIFSLYPATFLRRHEELKLLSIATSVGFMGLTFFTFLIKGGHNFSRLALLMAWFFAIIAVPVFRHLTRTRCAKYSWWSTPCVIFGNGARIFELCDALGKSQRQGVQPALLILDEQDPEPDLGAYAGHVAIERIPLADPLNARIVMSAVARKYAKAFAVVSFDSSDTQKRQTWLSVIDQCFQRIILIPEMSAGGRVWVMAVSIGRLSGIMLKQNLLDPHRMGLKRGIDLFCTLCAGIVIFPLLFLLGLAVRLDSHGPALFRQSRIGRNGKNFIVFKFRTMAANAAERLEKHLEKCPNARREWDETQKLKNDPRITRVGRFLRKTSLDELPQLINVLRGDMSIVGPRPIVSSEIKRYGEDYELYTRVRPGITGLWQISGRNDLSYADRVWLDRHYVCNWSVWLDILIVAKTIPEVLRGSGAY